MRKLELTSHAAFSTADLVCVLMKRSPYYRDLEPQLHQILELAHSNHAVREAIEAIFEHSNFAATGHVRPNQCKQQRNLVEAFFEYLFFASPTFVNRAARGR
jgi:hypothetical protein